MKNFTYHQPTSLALALPLLDEQWGKTELLAGGTDLHDLQKEYVAQPDKVVSLTGIKGDGFQQITVVGDPPKAMLAECEALLAGQVSPEFLRSQIEIGTRVCANLAEAHADLRRLACDCCFCGSTLRHGAGRRGDPPLRSPGYAEDH